MALARVGVPWWEKPPIRWIVIWLDMVQVCLMMCMVSVMIVISSIPFVRRNLQKLNSKVEPALAGIDIRVNFSMLRERFWPLVHNACSRQARIGRKVPDTELYDPKTKSVVKLLSLQRPGRPLVLNFGSCS